MLTICVGYGVLGLVNLGNPFPKALKSLLIGRYMKQVIFDKNAPCCRSLYI